MPMDGFAPKKDERCLAVTGVRVTTDVAVAVASFTTRPGCQVALYVLFSVAPVPRLLTDHVGKSVLVTLTELRRSLPGFETDSLKRGGTPVTFSMAG
jgi:hypothetical protein